VFHSNCGFRTDRSYGSYMIWTRSGRLRHMYCVQQKVEPVQSFIIKASKLRD